LRQRWAIIIGINGYHESLGALQFCVNDARLMKETLVLECCGFAPENIVVLTDDEPKDRVPTFGNIHSWLGTWLSQPAADDLILVYFAGHGRETNGKSVLAPLDSTLNSLPVTGIPISNIRDLLENCRASQKVLILDACHSGGGRDVATMSERFYRSLVSGHGLYTIASCDIGQISYEWPEKRHGIFTYYFTEAIRQIVSTEGNDIVTLDHVYEWTRKAIGDWTTIKRLNQEPVRICHLTGDIIIAGKGNAIIKKHTIADPNLSMETSDGNSNSVGPYLEPATSNKNISEPTRQKVSSTSAEVENWSNFVNMEGPHNPATFFALGFYSLSLLFFAFNGFDTRNPLIPDWSPSVELSLTLWLLVGPGISGFIYFCLYKRWRNRYFLYSAETYLKAGDYLHGMGYAIKIRRFGIERVKAADVVTDLADLASTLGDVYTARQLYDHAWEFWESSRAKRALDTLDKVV